MFSQKDKLIIALEIGNDLKTEHGFGKEYYAIYTGHMPDAILEFIANKIESMYPKLDVDTWISIPGVAFRLMKYKNSVYTVVDEMLYIHKASFKRHLKKAICRNRNVL